MGEGRSKQLASCR